MTAVSARPIDLTLAAAAADLGHTRAAAALAVLRAGRLARVAATAADSIETYHDRVRETVVGNLDADPLRDIHRQLARVLQGEADPRTLAEHYAGAGEIERAVEQALVAAERAAKQGAFQQAADLYRFVLERGRPDAGGSLRSKLANALSMAGRSVEAGRVFLEAAQGAPARDNRELRRLAGEQLIMGGNLDEGLELIRTMLFELGWALPTTPADGLRETGSSARSSNGEGFRSSQVRSASSATSSLRGSRPDG